MAEAKSPLMVTDEEARELSALRQRKMIGGPGIDLQTTPDGLTTRVQLRRLRHRDHDAPDLFHAVITGHGAINGGIRWRYTVSIGHWDMTQSPSTGGVFVSDIEQLTAFNSAEDMNTFVNPPTPTGPIGTGNTNVTWSNGQINGGACFLVPLPIGGYVIVMVRGLDTTQDNPVQYYTIIDFANSAQGSALAGGVGGGTP